MMNSSHLLVGCSFTDPLWQTAVPWSVVHAKKYPSYIVAKAGMGIKGICTEALTFLKFLPNVTTVIIILPTLWRHDLEIDEETPYLSNAMVDLLFADNNGHVIHEPARRKWLASGGLHFGNGNCPGKKFLKQIFKYQGFKVTAFEHLRALENLLSYCKEHKIQYYISAIQDPLDQLQGLEYISEDIKTALDNVEYNNWVRFDNVFIDNYLGHKMHPTTEEHEQLSEYLLKNIKF